MRNFLLITFVWVLSVCASQTARAETQDSDTLRVEKYHHFFLGYRNRILLGDEKLFDLGYFPTQAPAALFEQRSVEASQLYLKYQRLQSRSSWMVIGGFSLLGIGALALFGAQGDTEEGLAAGVVLGGVGVILGGMVVSVIADWSLWNSVTAYNRSGRAAPVDQPRAPRDPERRRE